MPTPFPTVSQRPYPNERPHTFDGVSALVQSIEVI